MCQTFGRENERFWHYQALGTSRLDREGCSRTLVNVFFTRFGAITGALFPMFLFGAVLAKLYTNSGAASAIADSVCSALFKSAKNDKTR